MKKQDFAKLALLGLTSGLFVNGQLSANDNNRNDNSSDAQIIAQLESEGKKLLNDIEENQKSFSGLAAATKHACKGPKGCPTVASRDTPKSNLQDPSKLADKYSSKTDDDKDSDDPNNGNLGYHLLTEDELLLELNDEATKTYNSLSPEGKALAREVASQRCNGTNDCKGLNACQTEHNKCAGQGACKGQSKCAFSDKNLAVKVVAKKMAEKRNGALNNKGNGK